jgi:hypothetical protein
MKKLFVAGMLALGFGFTSTAQAALYLIDFNVHTGSGYPNGPTAWNIYALPSDVTGTIKDSTGSTAAGITISQTGMADSTNTGAVAFNNTSGGPSWVTNDGTLNLTDAAADYFFTSTLVAGASMVASFANLPVGATLSIDVFMSRANQNSNGLFDYSLDNGNSWTGFTVLNKDGSPATGNSWGSNTTLTQDFQGQRDGNSNARYMNASNITLTGSTLRIRTTDVEVGTGVGAWTGISAIRLDVAAVPVPEPGTWGILFMVMAGVVVWQKRLR